MLPALLACATLAEIDPASTTEQTRQLRSELIQRVFNEFNKDTLHLLDAFYSADAVFEDPLGRREGLATIRAYYARMYKNVKSIRFDISNEVVEGSTHVIFWTLHMTVDGLNKGKPVETHGNSVLRFNEEDKVVQHRDYFDMGEMVYRHVPVLRYLVKKVNARLEPNS